MVGRVIDLSTDGRHIALDRGFITVSERGGRSAGSASMELPPSSPMPMA